MTWWCYGRRQICPQLFGYSAWNHAGFLGRPSQKTSPWKLRGAVVSRARFRIFGVPSNYRHDDGVEKRLWRPSARASPFMLCSASLRRRSADSEIRPDRALPQTASGQLVPLVTICLGGECRWLSSLPFTTKWWKGPGRLRWPPCRRFGVSGEYHHKKKAVQRTSEWETLGCRVAGTLGVMAPSPWRHQRPSSGSLGGSAMQFHAASKSVRSWLADGPGAFSSDEKLPARSHTCGPPSTPMHAHKNRLWKLLWTCWWSFVSCRSCASTCATASAL